MKMLSRAKTKTEVKKSEYVSQQKYNKNSGWNPGYTQTRNVEKGAREYREQQEYYRRQEQEKKEAIEKKEQEKKAFIKQIASVQDDEKAFTPADLYEAGIAEREKNNGYEATVRLWQALVCGDRRAAYPLFEVLRDGEGGIAKNMEMAGLILAVGKISGSQECRDYGGFYLPEVIICRTLTKVCYFSRDFILKPGYKITNEIMEARQAQANAALDEFTLKTRKHEEAVMDVFAHTETMNEELLAVELSGDQVEDTSSKKCIIM